MSASTVRMLTNVRSCLNQKPRLELLRDDAAGVALRSRRAPSARAARRAARRTRRRGTSRWPAECRRAPPPRSTCASDAPDARITVYSELATSCAMREQRADQRGDREQLVEPRRHVQRDEQQRRGERVAVAPDVAQLVDQVEEREQHEQRRRRSAASPTARRGRCSAAGVFMRARAAGGRRRSRAAKSPVTDSCWRNSSEHDARARSRAAAAGPPRSSMRALRDHALHDVEAVAVEHVQERRGDEVERAAHARIDVGQRDREQRRGSARRSAPRCARRARRARRWPSATTSAAVGIALVRRRHRAHLGRLDAPPELARTRRRGIRRVPGLALVAAAVLQHDEAVAVRASLELPARARPWSTSCLSSTECRNTLRIVPSNGLMLSTNTTRLARGTPGTARARAARSRRATRAAARIRACAARPRATGTATARRWRPGTAPRTSRIGLQPGGQRTGPT